MGQEALVVEGFLMVNRDQAPLINIYLYGLRLQAIFKVHLNGFNIWFNMHFVEPNVRRA